MSINDYSIDEHIHRFGLWTAARAASKSLLSNEEVEEVIQTIHLRQEIELLRSESGLDINIYQECLKKCCNRLIQAVNNLECKSIKKERISYGLAAKIISIYIKTVEVIPSGGTSKLSEVAFAPIDSILLRNINKKYKKRLNARWSKFNWDQYIKTINDLKEILGDQPMWHLEAEWYNLKKICKPKTTVNP